MLLIVHLITITPASAAPEVSIQNVTYPVSGNTTAQIRQSLDRNSPIQRDGRSFDAYTRWDVDWRLIWFEADDGTCRPTGATTHVRIHITLPALQHPEILQPALAERWARYLEALRDHEQGHADIGIAAARAIEAQLMRMGEHPSCSQLADEADAVAREIIARHAIMDVRYDTTTRFGARDGAIFR